MQIKQEMRKKILCLRNKMNPGEVIEKSQKIFDKLYNVPAFFKAVSYLFYFSFKNEVKTDIIMDKILASGKNIYLPCIDREKDLLQIYAANSLSECRKTEPYGIREPDPSIHRKLIDLSVLDVVVCPGIVFDLQGNRIGFGKGYYDKLLKKFKGKIPLIGLGYDFQIVKNIVKADWDISMDFVISEKRIIHI